MSMRQKLVKQIINNMFSKITIIDQNFKRNKKKRKRSKRKLCPPPPDYFENLSMNVGRLNCSIYVLCIHSFCKMLICTLTIYFYFTIIFDDLKKFLLNRVSHSTLPELLSRVIRIPVELSEKCAKS